MARNATGRIPSILASFPMNIVSKAKTKKGTKCLFYFITTVDAIYKKGNASGDYDIPAKYSSDLIETQLKLLEKLFPKEGAKKEKQANVSGTNPPAAAAPTSRESSSSASSSFNPSGSSTSQAANSTSAPKDTSNLAKKQKLNERNIRDYIPVVVEKGGMAKKLERAAPYNMFLTAITDSKPTHSESLSVTLQEILDESLGEIESSVQINFMVDIGWLLGHYYFAGILLVIFRFSVL